MEFKLNPPSGYADSYFDIEFNIMFEKCEKAIITFFNVDSSENLDIIGITSGYIKDSNIAIVYNSSTLNGHINLFNDDKMNSKFSSYRSIKIRCNIELFDKNDNMSQDSEILEFYNEGESLDSDILPFDFILTNSKIDIENNDPILVDIISGLDKKYEIIIKAENQSHECPMEFSCRTGKTSFHIPSEFVYYDLKLSSNKQKKYKFYYAKVQGVSFSRLASKKYIPINNSDIEFILPQGEIMPQPQSRKDPAGTELDNNFVISDRYLVLCPKEYSGFSSRSQIDAHSLINNTMLVHEGQNMQKINSEINKVSQFSSENKDNKNKIRETQKHIHDQKLKNQKINNVPKMSPNQFNLLKSLSGNYNDISKRGISRNLAKPTTSNDQPLSSSLFSNNADSSRNRDPNSSKKGGCSSCARKRKNA